MKKSKVIYINFAPYDNAGRILDYLVDNFFVVVHFSYDHLRLKKGKRSQLTVYKNGKIIYQKNLLWLRTHPFFLFFSLPFVALAILFQTIYYSYIFKKRFGKFDKLLTVNAYTTWVANIVKGLGITKKTIYWVWDYFPPNFPDWKLKLARSVYWLFDEPSRRNSDKVVFLNKKLFEIRIKGVNSKKAFIIPIGTNPIKSKVFSNKSIILGHMGMLKYGQGLDFLFDNLSKIIKKHPRTKLEIIGSGPEENHFKKRAKKFKKNVIFYGFVKDDNEVDKIIRSWNIGIATYSPAPWSEHYWTDPSKIKAYLNQAVPVIATSVPEFSKEVKKTKSGIIINYGASEELLKAIELILQNQEKFSKNALKLAKKYNYKKLYPELLR